jgi:phosphoribosyl 1,2-cyclic phosphate phosphodiesterase
VLIAPDELVGWHPPDFTKGVDLAILPMGVVEHDPFSGERKIPEDHPILKMEATFVETLEMIDAIGATRTVLTHIEEGDGLSYDDLGQLESRLQHDGRAISFAYDGQRIEVG